MSLRKLLNNAAEYETPWRFVGGANYGASIAFVGVSTGSFVLRWQPEPKLYEFKWKAGAVSLGLSLPVGVTFAPEDMLSLNPGCIYQLPGSTSQLTSMEILGPFVTIGATLSAGPGGNATLVFLGSKNKLQAAVISAGLRSPLFGAALLGFRAVGLILGTQASSPGATIDISSGFVHDRRVY